MDLFCTRLHAHNTNQLNNCQVFAASASVDAVAAVAAAV